jgi:hypothetical protein
MERSDDYARLRNQLDKLVADFHSVVSALTSLHSKNESDIERLQEMDEKLRVSLHTLDVAVAVLKADVDRLARGGGGQDLRDAIATLNKDVALVSQRVDTMITRPDLTPHRVPIDRSQPKSERPKGTDWNKVANDIGTKWTPIFAALAALLMTLLQQCGVIHAPPRPPASPAAVDAGVSAPR